MDAYYFRWKKTEQIQFTPHFNSVEFVCPCANSGCHFGQRINKALVYKLERIRVALGTPVVITSGYRCSAYQDELKARGYETALHSQHTLGNAADVQAPDMKRLQEEMEKEFKALGIALTFIHGDLRDDKERRWYYKGVKPDATS